MQAVTVQLTAQLTLQLAGEQAFYLTIGEAVSQAKTAQDLALGFIQSL